MLDVDATVGLLQFDNGALNYAVGGDGAHSLTLAGAARIDVVAGSHSVAAPIIGSGARLAKELLCLGRVEAPLAGNFDRHRAFKVGIPRLPDRTKTTHASREMISKRPTFFSGSANDVSSSR